MTGVDQWIAGLGRGRGMAIALVTALLLGLRHATDPDHLTAVSALTLSDGCGARRAARLGMAWGLGHATTLVLFGVPALMLRRYLPEAAQRGAEMLIGLLIIALAVRLLIRWRRGYFHGRAHRHGERWHAHPRGHEGAHGHAYARVHPHAERLGRSPLAAYGIGLAHGLAGSAAVTVLLIGVIGDRAEATLALVLFALATAVSMSALSAGFGTAVASRAVTRRLQSAIPLLAMLSVSFGAFYALSAIA